MKKLSVIITIFFLSCSTSQDKKDSTDTSIQQTTDTVANVVIPASDPAVNTQHGNEIELVFAKDSISASANGHLDSAGTVSCYFSIAKPGKLTATITVPRPAANIRFNQIILPDGKADGPFGRQLEYSLSQRGRYQLKIGRSLMANDGYMGDFVVRLRVE